MRVLRPRNFQLIVVVVGHNLSVNAKLVLHQYLPQFALQMAR
jgi:hypothetical protein